MITNYQDPRPWTGFDLDGTLAEAVEPWDPEKIGAPITRMKMLLLEYVATGKRVKIMTARVSLLDVPNHRGETGDEAFVANQHRVITAWLFQNIGFDLEVTCIKDYLMTELYDDRAWRVVTNTGRIVGQYTYHKFTLTNNKVRYESDFSERFENPFKPDPFKLDLTKLSEYFPDVGKKEGGSDSIPSNNGD